MYAIISEFKYKDGTVEVRGEANVEQKGNLLFGFCRRNPENGVEYLEERLFTVSLIKKKFHFISSLDDIFGNIPLQDNMIWDCILLVNNQYIQVNVPEGIKEIESTNYHVLHNGLLKAKPYKTQSNGLSICVIQNDVKVFIDRLNYFDGKIDLGIGNTIASLPENINIDLTLKRRKDEHVFSHEESLKVEPVVKGKLNYVIDINTVYPVGNDNTQNIWDFFVSLTAKDGSHVDTLLLTDFSRYNFKYFDIEENDLFHAKPYITSNYNSLALLIKQKRMDAEVTVVTKEKNNRVYIKGIIYSKEYNVWNLLEHNISLITKNDNNIDNLCYVQLLNTYFSFYYEGTLPTSCFLRTVNIWGNTVDIPLKIF